MNNHRIRIGLSSMVNAFTVLSLMLSLFMGPSAAKAAPDPSPLEAPFTTCADVTEIPQAECEALAALYNSTDGATWTNNTDWLQTDTPCSWFGVTCEAGHVVKILMGDNNLSGVIPGTIGDFTYLQQLWLHNNHLTGSLPPELSTLTNLGWLNLGGGNQLSGTIPPSLGNLTSLKCLWLNRNQFTGPIPLELGNLTNLVVLSLENNQLSGQVPEELGNLTSLSYMNISANPLTGSIPATLGSLTHLTELWLFETQVSGSIPVEIGDLTSLTRLGLHNNLLSGTLPAGIGNLTNLQHLSLANNQMSGELPSSITNLVNLTHLTLSCGLTSTDTAVIDFLNGKAPGWRCSNARFHAQMVQNDVVGISWPVGESVTLTIDNPANGEGVDFTDTLVADLNGFVLFSDLGGIDLTPGMYLTMRDNTILKHHTITDLMVGNVDINEDTVSGTGTPGARINVQYCQGGNCPWRRWATVGLDHTWNVDFSVIGTGEDEQQILDILSTTNGMAIQPDSDSDHTDYAWFEDPVGIIQAGLKYNWIEGRNFSPNSDVYVSIYDSEGGPLAYGPAPWTTSDQGRIWLNSFDHNLNIQPDMYITMLDAATNTLKSLVVQNLTITQVDYDAGLVSGTGPANVPVLVWLHDNGGFAQTTSNPDGTWTVDFGNPFSRGLWAGARVYDEDMDETFAEANWPNFSVSTDYDYVTARDWPLNELITLTIEDPIDGIVYQNSKMAAATGGNPDYSETNWNDTAELLPGRTAIVSGGGFTKEHIITDLTINSLDPELDRVYGTTSYGSNLWVEIPGSNGANRRFDVAGNFNWMADFREPGNTPETQSTYDLEAGTSGYAQDRDNDGDWTQVHWSVPDTSIIARLTQNLVHAIGWPAGTTLALTIEDPTTVTSPDYFNDSQVSQFDDPQDPNAGTSATFGLGDVYTLKPGDVVKMEGGGYSETMTVADIHITNVNIDIDSVSGTAGDGIDQVSVRLRGIPNSTTVTADVVNNAWTANFAGIHDIGPGSRVVAFWNDMNWNATTDFFNVPNPTIGASVKDNYIWGDQWPVGEAVILTVDDPANGAGIDFQQQQIPEPAEWDPGQTYVQFNLEGFQLQPHHLVEMTNGLFSKSLLVQYLEVTSVDPNTDIIAGKADPEVQVISHVEVPNGWAHRSVMSDVNGNWSANFSIAGQNENEQDIVDITYGTNTSTHRAEADGDFTEYGYVVDWIAPSSIPLVFAISSPVDLSVPTAWVDNISVLSTMLDSLFRLDKDNNLQPLAAATFSVSPNGLVYTVTLRSGALWSDGQPVLAQHFVDGIRRVLDPNVGSDYGFLLFPVKNARAFNEGSITDPSLVGVKALNDQTLEFTLEQPASHFPQILASPVVMPARQDVIDQYGNSWTSPAHFVSNGPYKLMEYDQGHILVEKNLLYTGPLQASFPQIGFDVIPNSADQVMAYKNGIVDVLLSTPLSTVIGDPELKNNLAVLPAPGFQYINFFTQVAPTNDPLVRKALASALDRQVLVDNILSAPWRVEATGVIPPELDGYQGSSVGYSYNPVQAQAYLAQAGYPAGAGLPALNFFVVSPAMGTILEEMKSQWEAVLGITVNIDYLTAAERGTILSNCRETPSACSYNGFPAGWMTDYPDAYNILNDLFSPAAPYNNTQWDNINYRDLMDLAVSELNPVQRISYLQQAEQILVQEDAAVMPLYYLDGTMVVRPGIYPYSSSSYFSSLAYWSDVDPAGDGMVAEVVGTDGGTLTTENNTASVEIPTGALDEDVTMSVTDQGGNYQITTSQNELNVLSSYSIQPHGLQFNAPVTLTFSWNDVGNDGVVDGTAQPETKIILIKDGDPITPACEFHPGCDMTANTISVEVLSLSHFELAVPANAPPVVDSTSFDVNEFAPNGTVVGTVTFSDTDTGQSHACEIQEGNTDNAFTVDANICEITVSNSTALEYATHPTFNLTVRVTDNGMPARHGDGSITISVIQPSTCYQLTLNSGPNGDDPTASPHKSNSCGSNGQYVAGEIIALTAHPYSGYQVASWLNTDDDLSTDSTNQITMPASDHTVTVTYEPFDATVPTVTSVKRKDPNPSISSSVDFTVTFSESVNGVTGDDFTLTTTGVSGTSIATVSGSGATYTVTVNTGTGNGTIRLDVVDNNSIIDAAGNSLGGSELGDGNFTSVEVYDIIKSAPSPSIPVLLSPANSGLLPILQPTLDWKDTTPAAHHYQLQVSANNTFTTLVIDEADLTTSEFTFTSDLDPGKRYYWRVRAFNILDQTKGWSEIWNFRTPLDTPTLAIPACGASLLTDRPTFDWLDVEDATSYTLQIAPTTSFGTLLLNATVPASGYAMSKDLPQNKTLYWRVRAQTSVVSSPWSEKCSFTTGNPPTVPVLASPANNALLKDYTPTLKWYKSSVPSGTLFKHYELQLDDNSDFSSPEIEFSTTDGLLTEASYTPPADLNPNIRYYWRVRAINLVGMDEHISGWSVVRSFRTVMLPPVLLLPANGSTEVTLKPPFDWEEVEGATSYTIQISTSPGFGTFLVNTKVTSSNFTPTTNLPKNKAIYWRVRANGPNGPSAWSTFQFTTPP